MSVRFDAAERCGAEPGGHLAQFDSGDERVSLLFNYTIKNPDG